MGLVFVLVVFLNVTTGQPIGEMDGLAKSAAECHVLANTAIAKARANPHGPPKTAQPVIYCLDLPSKKDATEATDL
jgi:hypothetical protein